MQPLPLELLTAGRDLTEPRLAPSGRPQVAFVQRTGATTSINAVWLDHDHRERILTFGPAPAPGRGVGGGCFTWVDRDDGLSLVYVARDGALWWQRGLDLVRIDGPATDGGVDPDDGPARACRAPAVDAAGTIVVYVIDEAEVWAADLSAIAGGADPAGSRRRLDVGTHEFCFDPSVAPDASRASWQAWSPPDMPWDGAARVDVDLSTSHVTTLRYDDAAVQQPRFRADGTTIQIDDRSGWLNVASVDGPLLAEAVEHAGPTWGMGTRSYAAEPAGDRVAVARNTQGFGNLVVVDPGALSDAAPHADLAVRPLGRGVYGHLDWVGDRIAALRAGARTPTQVVVHDVSTGERTVVAASAVDAWPLEHLPEPERVEAVTDDGATLFARRYAADQGRLLAWVHGGPTDQWRVDWRPRIHYWWSRGWDVLVVDPRGSTGHGRTYQQALQGEWGRRDVDDTARLIAHAHGSGWADPSSTVVIGGSSGGLTALGLLADHGGLVAGGVASYPVSDLRALTEATHRFEAHYTDTLVAPNDGSPHLDRRLDELSPVSRAAAIASPLLLFHGTDDPVVPIDQTRAFVDRVRAARPGADVTLIEYESEGHGFRLPGNVEDEYRRTEEFLVRVTGA